MNLSEKLFKTALRDLESVEILYESKHYNVALFQFQQCIEKLVKSFGLETKSIKSEDIAKKINHLPYKVFTRLYDIQSEELAKKTHPPLFIPDMVPPHQRDKTNIFNQLERTKELRLKILEYAELNKNGIVEEEKLKDFISGGKDLDQIPEINEVQLLKEIEDDFVKTNEHFIKYFDGDINIKEISEYYIQNSKIVAQNKLELHKKEIIRQRKYGYVEYVWINLCLITFSHEQSTRYPLIDSELLPEELYNEDSTIIKYLPELIIMLKKSIQKYREVYDK